jgi:hypothetical protein
MVVRGSLIPALALTTLGLSPPIELERLIDSNYQLPGTTAPIAFDGAPPDPCGEGVILRAFEDTPTAITSWAYYVATNQVRIIVDEETPVPNSNLPFERLYDSRCVSPGTVRFVSDFGAITSNVYEWSTSSPVTLVQSGHQVIGGVTFGALIDFGGDSQGTGILARLDPPTGEGLIYKSIGGPPELVLVDTTTLPGQDQPIRSINEPWALPGGLVFRALSSNQVGHFGLYRWWRDGTILVVADNNTPAPDAPGNLLGIGDALVLPSGIAFGALTSNGTSILLETDGTIRRLFGAGDQTVEGDTLASVGFLDGGGGLIAFRGTTTANPLPAIFVYTLDGRIRRLLGQGDTIEGRTVLDVFQGADHRYVAIRAQVGPLEWVIYRADFGTQIDIPTLSPAALTLLVTALLLSVAWHLRRTEPFRRP